ncbi:hypothetical protein NSQ14_11930 [Caldifermentibacillus hisashii]|uniref:hypothetical protein n=1 Tax=Caldifermentibacillus hisashii TaxID=996558 RepID=UPI0031016C83
MGMLYRSVNAINELKKRHIISELVALGVDGDGAINLYDLDYYELKSLLATLKRMGRDFNA